MLRMRLKNLFKMGLGAVEGNVLRQRIPLNVMLSVTNRCISKCNYCNIPNRKQKELSTKEIFNLIDEITKMGAQRIGLWGGEPLIREDIGDIIDYAKGKGLFVTLDSNGYLLESKMFRLNQLDHLILSLDGPEKMHDSNRGEGGFVNVMNAIKFIKGKINFWTVTVLTKNNLEGINFVLETASKYGFLASFQILHHNEIMGRNLDSLKPQDELYKKTIKKLIFKKKKGAPISSSFSYLYHLLNWQDYGKTTLDCKVDNLKCWAGDLFCNVDTDGSVYPCSLMVGKSKALNYLDVGFKKAFNHCTKDSCQACVAACFTEYNYLYSFNIKTIKEWIKAMYWS